MGPLPATGTLGVGIGVGVGVGPSTITRVGVGVGCGVSPGDCVGVGVAVGAGGDVGVGVGSWVGVGVGAPVEVGVAVGVLMVNLRVQAGTAASGASCGTVGATGCACRSLTVVRYVTTLIPAVMRAIRSKYQYFRKNVIIVTLLNC